jgi:hypothetical protein
MSKTSIFEDLSNWLGVGGRLEPYSGLAYKRKPFPRAKDFPYDRTNPDQAYGQPRAYDRGDGDREPDHVAALTPRDTSDSEWDKLAGIKGSKSGFEEAMGAPTFFAKADTSQQGTSTPAAGKGGGHGWAGNPTRSWDEDDMPEDELDAAGRNVAEVSTFPLEIPVASLENETAPYYHDTTDDELENFLDRIQAHGKDEFGPGNPDQYSEFPSVIMTVGEPGFTTGLGGAMKGQRDLYGVGWKECLDILAKEGAWQKLEKYLLKITENPISSLVRVGEHRK